MLVNDDASIGYKAMLTEDEYKALKEEFNEYNEWYLNNVLNRPFDSEIDYEFVAHSPVYDKWTLSHVEYDESGNIVDALVSWPVVYEDGSTYTESDEYTGIIRSYTEWMDVFDEIAVSIVKKYNPYGEFSIGYKLLPMTKKLIDNDTIYVRDGTYEYLNERVVD